MNSRSVVPKKRGRSPKKLTVSIDQRLLSAVRDTAKASGVSISQLTEKALTALLMSPACWATVDHGPQKARRLAVKLARLGAAPRIIADELNRRGFRTATGKEWSRVC